MAVVCNSILSMVCCHVAIIDYFFFSGVKRAITTPPIQAGYIYHLFTLRCSIAFPRMRSMLRNPQNDSISKTLRNVSIGDEGVYSCTFIDIDLDLIVYRGTFSFVVLGKETSPYLLISRLFLCLSVIVQQTSISFFLFVFYFLCLLLYSTLLFLFFVCLFVCFWVMANHFLIDLIWLAICLS